MTHTWATLLRVAGREGVLALEDLAQVIVTMAALPATVNLYEAISLMRR